MKREIIRRLYCGFLVIGSTYEAIDRKCRKIDLGDTNGFIWIENPHAVALIEQLQKENEELKASKRKMAIDCQMMMEDRDNKYIENTKLKQDNAWKDNKIELMQKIWELRNLLDS